jgi:hypothetical protein
MRLGAVSLVNEGFALAEPFAGLAMPPLRRPMPGIARFIGKAVL